MYQCHAHDMEEIQVLPSLNTLLVHFTHFQMEYHLIEASCIDTLEELTKRLCL